MAVDRSPKGLTRDVVVAAAVRLADDRGLDAVTIRAVAAAVGASPMAVYNHAADRDDLLVGMLDMATAALPVEVGGSEPIERLVQRYRAVHDQLAGRPWILRLLVRGDLVSTTTFALMDACIDDLLECGVAPADAIYAHGVAWHLVVGELVDRHPEPPARTPTQRDLALRAMDVTAYPNYAHVLDVLDPADAPPPCQFPRTIAITLPGVIEALRAR